MLSKMKKASIVGLAQNTTKIVESLQELGVVDIIHLNEEFDSGQIDKLQSKKNSIVSALKFLAGRTPETATTASSTAVDPAEIIQRTSEIRTRFDEIQEDRRRKQRLIDTWTVFGDFDPDQIKLLQKQNVYVQFFKTSDQAFPVEDDVFAEYDVIEVNRERQKVFFMTIGTKQLETTVCEELPLPDLGIQDAQTYLARMDTEAEALEAELARLAQQKTALENVWKSTENQHAFHKALSQHVVNGELFYMQGWIPEDKLDSLENLSNNEGFVLLTEDPADDENPPTAMKNGTIGEIGESLVDIYDTPSYRDIDPNSTVFIFFALFFGMIIGDVGYGSVLLILTLLLAKGPSAKLFRKLGITISCSTILFGVLNASYFAINIDAGTALGKFLYTIAPLYRDTNTKEGLMSSMFISLWVGVLNLGFVNLYKAIHDKKISPIGWIITSLGLIPLFKMLFSVKMSALEEAVGLIPLIGGLLFTATMNAVETKSSIGGRLSAFAATLQSIVNLFADLLSYLRIFALAMAGAQMARTFNMLFGMIYSDGAILNLILGIFVLLIGHGLNLVLNIMSGTIHGLRLNFIESYHWCFDGGGKKYQPLAKLKVNE